MILRKYWSPKDQSNTELGIKLINAQNLLTDGLNIDQLKAEFLSNLKKGKYWNFGSAELKK
jgi:hypothetical protein